MKTWTDIPDTIVFDAEPLVAYFCNELGSDIVEVYIDAIEGSADGFISAVNLAEVHYIVRALDSEERADAVIDVLEESGICRVDTEETWPFAADFVRDAEDRFWAVDVNLAAGYRDSGLEPALCESISTSLPDR